ncbi:hypothetical protein NQ317_008516 [Molorchus minor]|uniref:Uncharacterized protein n=1 Tax=Molorchus minor TaxID=1323400 RepID=A0ABQ9J495_9CUCU|nr:hypothetical protein NQ317_008516 [Molorchus minor]
MSDSADELSKSEELSFNNKSRSPNFVETYNAWHEMLEAESRGVAGRVADLERKVLEQGDELVCLKATLAEALRRLNTLEGMRLNQVLSSVPSTPIRINGTSKDTFRQRPISYSASKTDSQRRPFTGSSLPQRRAVHYQSTGSLHSDSQSSSSVSPHSVPIAKGDSLPLNGKKADG